MGEIAEDLTDGTCCSRCYSYFFNEAQDALYTHEYPVACKTCWNEDTQTCLDLGLQCAQASTLTEIEESENNLT
jgi:hypothetical protein